MPIVQESASDISKRIRTQELSCEEYIESLVDKIRKSEIHAFLSINENAVLEAKSLDLKIRSGHQRVGSLCGIGIALKDNICTSNLVTTCASNMLSNYTPPYDSTVVQRIKAADGIILGKTNMDEFAMGGTTENSFFGPTMNPVDKTLVPGGSSGGSAAAIRSGLCTLALGSDTGGSVRNPASFCGIAGMKPTYGSISRYGLVAFANSLELIGPLGRRSSDCELIFRAVSGYDPLDATSMLSLEERHIPDIRSDLKGVKIGLPKPLFDGVQSVVLDSVNDAISRLRDAGAECIEIPMNYLDIAVAVYYIIAMAEASSNLARYNGLRYGLSATKEGIEWGEAISEVRTTGFGSEVKRRILLGTFVLSAGYAEQYYLKAQKIRSVLKMEFDKAWKRFDYLLSPTMPTLPFKLGEKVDPVDLYQIDVETVPANLVGFPAVSIPCGESNSRPIGMQLMAPSFHDYSLLSLCKMVETLISQ